MENNKDNTNIVSKEMGNRLRKRLYKTQKLNDYFRQYITNETFCKYDIIQFLGRYGSILVQSNLIRNDDLQNFGINEVLERNINNTSKLLENIFAAGILYGAARSDETFYRQISDLENKEVIENLEEKLDNLEFGLDIEGNPFDISQFFEEDDDNKEDPLI